MKRAHPSNSELERFDRGQLTDGASIWIERHLEQCQRCCKLLSGIDGNDQFVSRIQEAISRTGELEIDPSSAQAHNVTKTGSQSTRHSTPGDDRGSQDNEQQEELSKRPFGQFTLLKRIGRGGFGVVWLAFDSQLQRQVALKLPHQGTLENELASKQFIREARAIACLQHANIVQVYESGTIDNWCYLATEYCPGLDLAHWLRSHPEELGYAEIASIIRQLAFAVHHAHQRGVLHRDLKPSNVLLDPVADSQNDAGSTRFGFVPKISDFGLAKLTLSDPQETASQVLMGTASYMAPEQAEGSRRTDRAADIYSLGAIFYELLTGQPPFCGSTQLETLYRVKHDSIVSPSRIRSSVPRDLEAICLRCLEYRPSNRYSSAELLGQDLCRWEKNLPIMARRLNRVERMLRWCRRKPWNAAALILLILLAIVMSIFSLVIWSDRNKMATTLADLQIAEADARTAERTAQHRLLDALRAEIREKSTSSTPGSRLSGLDKAAEATMLARQLGQPDTVLAELRTHAIACLEGSVDLQDDCRWSIFPEGNAGNGLAFDPDLETFAIWTDDKNISIRSTATNRELMQVDIPDANRKQDSWRTFLKFSPNGRYLATCGASGLLNCKVWDLQQSGRVVVDAAALGTWDSDRFDFSSDSRRYICADSKGTVRIFDLSSGEMVEQFELGHPVRCLRNHPSKNQIAYTWGVTVVNYDLDSQSELWRVEFAEEEDVFEIGWLSDGQGVLVTQDNDVVLCAAGEEVRRYLGHEGSVVFACEHPEGQFLATTSWDGTSRIWDMESAEELLRIEGEFVFGFSKDGNWLAFGQSGVDVGRWRFATSNAIKQLQSDGTTHQLEFVADGEVLVSGDNEGLRFWDLDRQELLADKQLGRVHSIQVCNDQRSMVVSSKAGISIEPIQIDIDQDLLVTIGPPKTVEGSFDLFSGPMSASASGKVLIANATESKETLIVDSQTDEYRALPNYQSWRHDISPCGSMLATSDYNHGECLLWDLQDNEVIHRFEARSAIPNFSPNGKWLVVGLPLDFHVIDVKTQSVKTVLARSVANGHRLSAFSESSQIMAAVVARDQVRLYETSSWTEIATFRLPVVGFIESIALSAYGNQLACGTRDGRIVVWDLDEIRTQLGLLHLDWQASGIPIEETARPVKLMIEN